MRTWIWPITWYLRIRRLEAEVASLKAENRELDSMLRSAAIQQTSLTATYVAAMAAVSSMIR